MKSWWQRRSLKLRLALWYAVATALVLIAFAWFVYEVIEHRLAAEMDRQLRIDFDLVEGQLDVAPDGGIHWTARGSHGDEGLARNDSRRSCGAMSGSALSLTSASAHRPCYRCYSRPPVGDRSPGGT